MSDTATAVLDRIVDGTTAVLLLEEGGAVVDEYTLEVDRLPADGRHEGAVFAVTVEGDALLEVDYRPDDERDRKAAAQDRFDRLSERLPDEETTDG
ncbi:DUF3006 domain-containing protein [Natronococcus wangiae]|uniref:DUF3006 domain-containing protein n=1 Tax=Natronococcus wangiae TaxID=3068275 RepID=UPI00273E304B|nr:DUF3006 domain-containing protein [Natronococcus sp. AD5]